MGFWKQLKYDLRENLPIFGYKRAAEAAYLYGEIQRINASVSEWQVRIGHSDDETKQMVLSDHVVGWAKQGLYVIQEYEKEVDLKLRERVDGQRGLGSEFSVDNIKQRLEQIVGPREKTEQ